MGRVDFRDSLRPDEFVRYRCRTWWKADGKVIIERLWISLPYVETFNSKVIKGFVPELRSRECFCVSGFLCSMYICYEHSMYVSHIHVWVCYNLLQVFLTVSMFKLVHAVVILAFSSSLMLHGVLLVSCSTVPHT